MLLLIAYEGQGKACMSLAISTYSSSASFLAPVNTYVGTVMFNQVTNIPMHID